MSKHQVRFKGVSVARVDLKKTLQLLEYTVADLVSMSSLGRGRRLALLDVCEGIPTAVGASEGATAPATPREITDARDGAILKGKDDYCRIRKQNWMSPCTVFQLVSFDSLE